MNDSISHEDSAATPKTVDGTVAIKEVEALGSDDAEITPDNTEECFLSSLVVRLGVHLEPVQNICLTYTT